MSSPDFPALAAAAQRCVASYIMDDAAARGAFHALGCEVLGRISNQRHQAVLSRVVGEIKLTISGTRFSEGAVRLRIADVLRDIECSPIDVGGGALVASGAYAGVDELWAWVISNLTAAGIDPATAVVDVEGHSLGGWKTQYLPLVAPAVNLGTMTAFEPPKAGDANFWRIHGDAFLGLTVVVHEKDPWFAWPWLGSPLQQRPGNSLLWLHDSGWALISEDQWPGAGSRFSDHDSEADVASLSDLARRAAALAGQVPALQLA